jgi:hypothetical protein
MMLGLRTRMIPTVTRLCLNIRTQGISGFGIGYGSFFKLSDDK